jgi:hypothetical protein
MDFTVYDIALVPLIMAIIGLMKKNGVPTKWLPLISLVLGLGGGFVYIAPNDPKEAVIVGLVMGLSAIGAHSGLKNSVEKRKL